MPINLPAGWNWDDLLGGDAARTALANEAAANAQPQDMAEAVELPETALNFATPLRNGLVLVFIGRAGLWWSGRRRSSAR